MNIPLALQLLIKDIRETLGVVGQDYRGLEKRVARLENKPVDSNLLEPLTDEQEKIVQEFSKNKKLPEEIRRGFASGGYVGMSAALGRFGEATSEQTRARDQYPSPTPDPKE